MVGTPSFHWWGTWVQFMVQGTGVLCATWHSQKKRETVELKYFPQKKKKNA